MAKINDYIKLRDSFSSEIAQLQYEAEISAWDFYINSTDENLKTYTSAQENFSNFFKNKELYNQLKVFENIETSDKHLKKQIKDLIKTFYNEIESGDELKALRDKENEIAAKYNSFVLKIDGKPTTKTEISKILETEKDVLLREKAYLSNIEAGDFISKDLVELVKMRNEYAKTKGYNNFFEYMIEDSYDITPTVLDKLLVGVYEKIKNKSEIYNIETREKLSKEFNINEADIKDYHYGLLVKGTPEQKVNEYLKTDEQIVDISKNVYHNMGFNLDKIILDLFPRKNKNTHGFAFCIRPGKDARILANLTHNLRSLDTLLHELGHCVYDTGIDTNLPFLEQDCVTPAMTEAIAMMMGDLPYTENILKPIVPEDLLNEFKPNIKKEDAKFVNRSLQIIMFEREMYKNPEQDLAKLWQTMKKKYLNRNDNSFINNEWATIPHYLSHPGYYQNYFRAALIKVQLYETMKKELNEITTNNKTSKYLTEKLFKLGSSLTEEEFMINITGKPLSEEDFCNRIIY